MSYVIAAMNYAIAMYDEDDERFAGFVDNLDRINALAESSPGFIWRYVSTDNDAEAKRVFADDNLIFNMSMWRTVEDLRRFTYESDHLDILRQRGDWFVPQQGPTMALWWQPEELQPGVTDARHRLECLRNSGPGPDAFTFRQAFGPPQA